MGDKIIIFPRSEPFIDNTETHVAKSDEHEGELGEEFKKEVKREVEMNAIDSFENDSERHLADSNDDGHFHFERVEEGQLVRCVEPLGVHAERVYAIGNAFCD